MILRARSAGEHGTRRDSAGYARGSWRSWDALAMIGTLVVVMVVASAVTRALLRLDTLDYGDRGGPS